jgi:hypothetical protein
MILEQVTDPPLKSQRDLKRRIVTFGLRQRGEPAQVGE